MLGTSQSGEMGTRQPVALSKYHIVRRLGSGGMAEIYLARSLGIEGFEKHVVLKRILPEHSKNPAFIRMFLDEARLAAKLAHQNIAQVYDIGRIADGYFFVMEYLHGRDLRSLKREHRKRATRLPIHHALTIAAGAAAGLDYAHNATDRKGRKLNLVHRDVSPSNIVVTFDGAVKLVDFGIARVSDAPSETRSGALKGKVPYMSPEQCRGYDLDGRSDIFSLGITLYELTTGISPFCDKGDTDFTVLEKICAGSFVRPSDVVTSYPPSVERIVSRALMGDRELRYQSARDFLRDLENAAAELGVPLSATALADHLKSIYGEQPMPWMEGAANTAIGDDDDDLLQKTIATGSVIEGVTLFEVTPGATSAPLSLNSQTSLRPRRHLLWLGAAALIAIGGLALAFSTMRGDKEPAATAEDAAELAPSAAKPAAAPIEPAAKIDEPPATPALTPAVSEPPPAEIANETADEAEPNTRERKSKSKRRTKSDKKESSSSRVESGPSIEKITPSSDKKTQNDNKKDLLDREW